MKLFFIIMLICMADSTQGAECIEGQRCSGCDERGNCLHSCERGYFGMKCKSHCSSTCRYKTCQLDPGKGTSKCTDGCVPGYQGVRCERPCDSHVANCKLCPGGCDGEYCQLGDACFAGCRDSRYGSGCKTCHSNCRTCNRMTGVCDECDPTHYGVNCEKTCENCAGSCEAGCECVPGFYGDFCAETCSKTCRPKSAHKCLPAVTSDRCTGECHKHSATCLHGCVDGWFGPRCSSPCNPGCRHQRCNAAGSCAEGCELHHFGSACEPCPENCANRTCDQSTGACVTDCSPSEEGSESNCTSTCTPPGCSSAYRNATLPEVHHTSSATLIWVVCTAVLFVLVASSVCCVCFRKGPCVQRSTHAETGTNNTDATYMHYQEMDKYWEIRENEAEVGEGIPNQNHDSTSDVSDDALPVLADYFPGDVNVEAGDGDIEAGDGDKKQAMVTLKQTMVTLKKAMVTMEQEMSVIQFPTPTHTSRGTFPLLT
ncbi:multiple epidermal growth factor-like domains protein 10 [Haliotis rubra]|uniref:multiple epidermal growth factor-like domains protein 10 n=1 Tax=Haliotis rubra TaxID=36100 RepID=UPI001EE549D4|nr:multiple epidermal growth factor-like domains protein 10 [Haliotis rubra]